ncbi:hypothetical protein, partial [Stenotrophomonas maltophilia]|uniref:hypothetical protein n=1 Tax=Stenotrophomonas maltophilia TaxID=40324 RepID=UPI0019536CDB
PFLWAALCWVLSYLGVLAIMFTEERQPQLPAKLRLTHARIRATGRIEALPSALGAYDPTKWQAILATRPD